MEEKMKKRSKPNSRGGELGQRHEQNFYKPHHFNKKYDRILLRNIIDQNLGMVSQLAFEELMCHYRRLG
jgi:hypothetical protein